MSELSVWFRPSASISPTTAALAAVGRARLGAAPLLALAAPAASALRRRGRARPRLGLGLSDRQASLVLFLGAGEKLAALSLRLLT